MRRRSAVPLRVGIIGAGVSSLALAARLRRLQGVTFTIFEQSGGPGGTWHDNTYPGCEVDVPSHAYSFSFMPYDWSATFARQPEMLAYIEHTIDTLELRPRYQFGMAVTEVRWDDRQKVWQLRLADGSCQVFDVIVSAVGLLNNPKYPGWPGLDGFRGKAFHTARWDHGCDLRGRAVAVVGVGSSGAQVIPAIAADVAHLYVFQREPGWVVPKSSRPYTARERARSRRSPLRRRIERYRAFWVRENRARVRGLFYADTKEQHQMQATLTTHIAALVPDRQLRAELTPAFPFGCKRPVIANDYYETFSRHNVTLVPHAIARVTPSGLVDAVGGAYDVDVIVLATGFHATEVLESVDVVGPGGRRLYGNGESARAFLGISVAGYPNFFMLYGPNTNGGVSIISQAERQADAIVVALRGLRRRARRIVDTSPRAMSLFVKWCDAANARRNAASPAFCTNYYYAADGRNVTQWPATSRIYWLFTKTLWRCGLRYQA